MLLAGCASDLAWYKTGATQRDFDMDSARCRMGVAGLPQSTQASPAPIGRGEHITQAGRDFSDLATSAQYIRDCMTAQGWTLR